MKQKVMILLAFLAGMFVFASCNDDDDNYDANVPNEVQKQFKKRFPGVNDVKWDVVKDYHVARFNAPAKTRSVEKMYNSSAWFSKQGKYYQANEDIEFAALPAVVQEAFKKYKEQWYPAWKVDDCEMLAREGMATIFVIEIEDETEDLEREISISESGDILKDVLDDDDEDEILPIIIPEEVHAALKTIFPNTYMNLSILELEFDDDEIEIDVMESDKHKEVELNLQYELVSIEYKVSLTEAKLMIAEEVFQQVVDMARQEGIDILDAANEKYLEIEVKEKAAGSSYEIEFEKDDIEFEVKIDEEGNVRIKRKTNS